MIYFIQVENNGPFKIGTAKHPEQRLKDLQIGNHKVLRLIAVIPGESHLERNGEWFNPTPQVLDYIQNIQFVENEGLHAVLWRNTEESETDTCPFCGRRHRHGTGDGHRVVHCGNSDTVWTKKKRKRWNRTRTRTRIHHSHKR